MLPSILAYVLLCMLRLYDVMRYGVGVLRVLGVLATVYMSYDGGWLLNANMFDQVRQ